MEQSGDRRDVLTQVTAMGRLPHLIYHTCGTGDTPGTPVAVNGTTGKTAIPRAEAGGTRSRPGRFPVDPRRSDCPRDAPPARPSHPSQGFRFSGTIPWSAVSVLSDKPLMDATPCRHESGSLGSLAGPSGRTWTLRGSQPGGSAVAALGDGSP